MISLKGPINRIHSQNAHEDHENRHLDQHQMRDKMGHMDEENGQIDEQNSSMDKQNHQQKQQLTRKNLVQNGLLEQQMDQHILIKNLKINIQNNKFQKTNLANHFVKHHFQTPVLARKAHVHQHHFIEHHDQINC